MKNFYYAVQKQNKMAHVLTVREGGNVAAVVRDLKLIIAHPCKTYAEAVKTVEAWKAAQV